SDAAVAKGENLSGVYAKAADYFIDEEDTETAKVYLDKSIAIEKTHYNVYLSAHLMKDEDLKEALKLAGEAMELATEAEKQGWVDYIKRKSEEWE
ncbi:MAG: hypothetical protein HRT57_06190, partial [Crocinitomicaceae bacterium]|nr:hypothetical protein [Crocinitomicaceae bacterium]